MKLVTVRHKAVVDSDVGSCFRVGEGDQVRETNLVTGAMGQLPCNVNGLRSVFSFPTTSATNSATVYSYRHDVIEHSYPEKPVAYVTSFLCELRAPVNFRKRAGV